MFNKFRKFFVIFCFITSSALLSLAGLEYLLKSVNYQIVDIPFSWVQSSYGMDKDLIYRVLPNVNDPQGNMYTNCFGARTEVPEECTDARNKIIVTMLGDSFVFGMTETSTGESYPSQMKKLLNDNGNNYEVYNFGAPGYGTDQELIYFEKYILPKVKPDFVVWNIILNDITDNIDRPLFDIRDNQLKRIPTWKNGVYLVGRIINADKKGYFSQSRLMNFILNRLVKLNFRFKSHSDPTQWAVNKIKLQVGRMRELSARHDFKIIIAISPVQSLVLEMPDEADDRKVYRLILSELTDVELVNQVEYFKKYAEENGLTDLSSIYIDESSYLSKGNWHPNKSGNKIMAESVVPKIRQD